MLNIDTPLGTRVRRVLDGKTGTVVAVRAYYPFDGEQAVIDVGSVSVLLDDDGLVWSGTYEAWETDPARRIDEFTDLLRAALIASNEAGYRTGRYVGGGGTIEQTREADRKDHEATVAMWRAFYNIFERN